MYVEDKVKPEIVRFVEKLFATDDVERLPSIPWSKAMAAQALRNLGLDERWAERVCVAEAKRALRIEQPAPELKTAISEYKQQRVAFHRRELPVVGRAYDIKPVNTTAHELLKNCFREHMTELGGEFSRSEVQGARFTVMGVQHLREDLDLEILLYGKIDEPLGLHFTVVVVAADAPVSEITLSKIVGRGAWKLSLAALSKEKLDAQLIEPFEIMTFLVAAFSE